MSAPSGHRGRFAWWVLVLVLPLVELGILISVGRAIGAWPTIALLVVETVVGAWLVRREGAAAWRELRTAVATGRLPARELGDATIVLAGGLLLVLPGLLTDLLGFLAVLPVTRPAARGVLARLVARRVVRAAGPAGPTVRPGAVTFGRGFPPGRRGSSPSSGAGQRPGTHADDDVIEGEIL